MSTPMATSRYPMGRGSATSRTRQSWNSTAYHDRRRLARLLTRWPACSIAGLLRRRQSILCSRGVGFLLLILDQLRLRRLQLVDLLLQANDGALERLDLPVGGLDFLLMVDAEFGHRLHQEIDVALQAAGAPLHGL